MENMQLQPGTVTIKNISDTAVFFNIVVPNKSDAQIEIPADGELKIQVKSAGELYKYLSQVNDKLTAEFLPEGEAIANDKQAFDDALADETITQIDLGAELTDDLEVNRAVTINGNGNKLSGSVTISSDDVTLKDVELDKKLEVGNNNITLEGVTLDATSESVDGVGLIKVTGDNFTIKDSIIKGMSEDGTSKPSGIEFVGDKSLVVIDGVKFENLDNVYNVLNFDRSTNSKIKDVTIKNCIFAKSAHNAISIFDFEENANVVIEGCTIPSMRISNKSNGTATVTIKDCKATNDYLESELLTIQQINSEQLTKLTVNIENTKDSEGTVYTSDESGKPKAVNYYSSTEEDHQIKQENKPTINYV